MEDQVGKMTCIERNPKLSPESGQEGDDVDRERKGSAEGRKAIREGDAFR